MNNIGLVKRFNGVLRLYVNTGSLFIGTNDVTAVNVTPAYLFSANNSTFNNVCPFTNKQFRYNNYCCWWY